MRYPSLLILIIFFQTFSQSLNAQIQTNGLIAYYPFNGNANDESGFGRHGTMVNTSGFGVGIRNHGVQLSGNCASGFCEGDQGGHVLLPMLPFNSMSAFSINIWVNEMDMVYPDGEAYICYGNDQTGVVQISHFSNVLTFSVSATTYINVPFDSKDRGKYVMYTLVYSDGKLKAYKNGIKLGETNGAVAVGENSAAIGRHWWWSTSTRFKGNIDEVRIYDMAISGLDIQALYKEASNIVTPETGLVAYYPFDDGTAMDKSGNANHGTIFGALSATDNRGTPNKAMQFNGENNYISIPSSTSLESPQNALTITAWAKYTEFNQGHSIVCKTDQNAIFQYRLGINYVGPFIGFQNSPGGYFDFNPNAPISENEWKFIAATIDGQNINLYVNNVLISSYPFQGQIYADENPLEIGRDAHGGMEYFKGSIDEVRIYNRALSKSELESLYFTQVPAKENFSTFSFSKSQIGGNQTMQIQGNGFSPNGLGKLIFSGAGGEYEKDVVLDADGRFSMIYAIPADATTGFVNVRAFDLNAEQFCTQIKTFEIIDLSLPKNYLQLDRFLEGTRYKVGSKVSMGWDDKLFRNYGDVYYPLEQTTGRRQFKYKVEIQTTENGPWELLKFEEGVGLVGGGVIRSVEKIFNSPTNYCRYRVTDMFVPDIMKISDVFSVEEIANNVDVTLLWDKSFPTPLRNPRGVAADGVARLLLKVKRKDKNAGFPILNATAMIVDPMYSDVKMVGKLMAATKTSEYDTEANAAELSSANSIVNASEDVWFWYVAPDNFCDGNAGCDALSERSVTIRIEVNFSNGTPQIVEVPMLIVRPPLVLVHGVASGPDTWDNFGYTGSLGYKNLFKDASWLYQIERIKLDGRGAFTANAVKLLGANMPNPSQNTLQGNIYAMRNIWGFACNQVDYVCHSMGGLVLRTAMTVLGNKFYGTAGSANDVFKTYGKGFVHKAITINTPHWGSPVADLISEELPKLPWYKRKVIDQIYDDFPNAPMLWDFIQPSPSGFLGWETTPAVKDMQIENEGKDLLAVNVKSHLVVGDVNLLTKKAAEALRGQLPFYKFMNNLYSAAAKVPGPQKPMLKAIGTGYEVLDALAFMEYYSSKKGFDNFLGDGDLVVPVKSQLAGLSEGANNVTVFENNSEGILNANHLTIKDRLDVGDRIKTLLNAPLESALFGDGFPATPVNNNGNGGGSWLIKGAVQQQTIQREYNDTSKIKILKPARLEIVNPDSVLNIFYKIKDTSNLSSIEISFQGNTHTSDKRDSIQKYSFIASNSIQLQPLIIATATYNIGDSIVEYYTDTVSISLKNQDTLIGFKTKNKSFSVSANDVITPEWYALFQRSILQVSPSNKDIAVSFSNTGLMNFNTTLGKFIVNADTGATFAIVTYKGFSDTIFFSINSLSSGSCVNRTVSSGIFSNPAIWSKGMVPGTCDSIVIMPGHSINIDTAVSISAIYIAPSASLTLDSSKITIQIGSPDDGNKTIDNFGALNLFRGNMLLNGSLQLQIGSSYKQSGGQLTIDGNTLFASTSVPNGQHLFNASSSMANFSFTDGTLQFIDPPLGMNSQAINCSFNFGDSSTLIFGDGISTTLSNNPNGFGGNLLPARIGKLIIDTKTTNGNRRFINLNTISAKSPVQIISGELIQNARFEIRQ